MDENRTIRTSGRYEKRQVKDGEEREYVRIGRKKNSSGKIRSAGDQDMQKKSDEAEALHAGKEPDGEKESDAEKGPDAGKKTDKEDGQDSGKEKKGRGMFGKHPIRKTGRAIRSVAVKGKKAADKINHIEQEQAEPQDADSYAEQYADKLIRKVKKAAMTVAAHVFHLFLSVASSFLSMLGAVIVISAVLIVVAVSAVQNATYDFLVDEEQRIREAISQINGEFTAEISRMQAETGCEKVVTYGSLAPWKEIIAFWWTFKSQCTDTENWNDYLTGNDHDDIGKIFYEFNHVESEVKEQDGTRYLEIRITTVSVDDMVEDYQFTAEQRKFLDTLLADDAVWAELLYSDELAMYASQETGQSREKYAEWYPLSEGEGWNMAWMMYVLGQAGYLDVCVTKTNDAAAFRQELSLGGYIKYLNPKQGDIIFFDVNGKLTVGIITRIDDHVYYITLGDYVGSEVVCEIALGKNNGSIRGFAGIDMSLPARLPHSSDIVAAGELIWPASGNYIVTSRYGPRDMFGRSFHYGMDIACPTGTPVLAAADGTVVTASYNSASGNYVLIDHGEFRTVYMHNSSLLVVQGDIVAGGQTIALSGSTGQSTGPHCHFGVSVGGYVDPAPYLGLPEGFEGDAGGYIK